MKQSPIPLTWLNLTRDRAQGTNAGAVTVTAALTVVVTADIVGRVDGDVFFVWYTLPILKGATGGSTYIELDETAGAAINWLGLDALHEQSMPSHPATVTWYAQGFAIGIGFGNSTPLTIRVRALSNGSDSTVALGTAALYVATFRAPNDV